MTENNEAPAYRRPSDDDTEGHALRRPDAQLGEESNEDEVQGHAMRRPDAQLGEETGDDDVQGHAYKAF
jgi:hypothetical protein